MVISPLGLPGVNAAELVGEAKRREQDHVANLLQANAENLASVTRKRLSTVTLILARVRIIEYFTLFCRNIDGPDCYTVRKQ